MAYLLILLNSSNLLPLEMTMHAAKVVILLELSVRAKPRIAVLHLRCASPRPTNVAGFHGRKKLANE